MERPSAAHRQQAPHGATVAVSPHRCDTPSNDSCDSSVACSDGNRVSFSTNGCHSVAVDLEPTIVPVGGEHRSRRSSCSCASFGKGAPRTPRTMVQAWHTQESCVTPMEASSSTETTLGESTETAAAFEAEPAQHATASSPRRPASPGVVRQRLLRMLEEPFSSRRATQLSSVFMAVIAASLILPCVKKPAPAFRQGGSPWMVAAFAAELAINVFFSFEIALRLWCSKRWRFFLARTTNCIDIACMVPFLLIDMGHADVNLGWPALRRMKHFEFCARLLKFLRYVPQGRLVAVALGDAVPALLLSLAMLGFLTGVAACGLLFVEDGLEPAGLADPASGGAGRTKETADGDGTSPALLDTLLFCFLLFVTNDAGPFYDFTVKLDAARGFLSLLLLAGHVVMAMPIAVVGMCFCRVWFQRHLILFTDAVRRQLNREDGSVRECLWRHFQRYDTCTDGGLDPDEFRCFVADFMPNPTTERVLAIFAVYDQDQDGVVDFEDLYVSLCPELDHGDGRDADSPSREAAREDVESAGVPAGDGGSQCAYGSESSSRGHQDSAHHSAQAANGHCQPEDASTQSLAHWYAVAALTGIAGGFPPSRHHLLRTPRGSGESRRSRRADRGKSPCFKEPMPSRGSSRQDAASPASSLGGHGVLIGSSEFQSEAPTSRCTSCMSLLHSEPGLPWQSVLGPRRRPSTTSSDGGVHVQLPQNMDLYSVKEQANSVESSHSTSSITGGGSALREPDAVVVQVVPAGASSPARFSAPAAPESRRPRFEPSTSNRNSVVNVATRARMTWGDGEEEEFMQPRAPTRTKKR